MLAQHLVELVTEILDFPRHLSQHVGGMVMTRGPLCELVPIENAAMPGRTVVQWDKDDLDALGILKVDCLALGMLTAIRKCFALVERHHDRRLTLANIPSNDRRVYDMVCRADTMGVFQIESRAQMAMLPRLRPRCFYDLVIEVAIVRPGPIQGDMVHPYLRRRCGEEPVEYPDERIREVLSKTLGVPIFQEQAMRLAIVAAGFTPGEADQLRRAMGAWRRRGVIDQFQQKLMAGMHANGYSTDFAERLFRQIRGFGEYGFPESHAASFALLVYVSAWLKHHYPAAFTAALLNSQPMGFYAAAQLVADARKHGATVLPADVNFSDWDCTLAQADGETRLPALRLGLRMIAGLPQAHSRRIAERRGARPFASVEEFARRTGLSSSVLTRLSQADAFQSLRLNRRESLWQSLPDHSPMPLFDADTSADRPLDDEPAVPLPELLPVEEVVADYRTIGLSLRDHPVKFLRPQLNELRAVPAAKLAALPHGRRVRVAGLVLMRQRPSTASGVTFVTLEDETGMANLIVYPAVWERYRRAARSATIMQVDGVLQRQGEIIHVLVSRLADLSQQLTAVQTRSRDFR
jgi:error-prone DNA polymerase